ncbi:MAG: signal peptidase II [Burkholderiaceae bacterium]|nr:MAG: signal peptidase II [Burkholderiaceae bacterium]
MAKQSSSFVKWLLLAAILLVLDQFTKTLIVGFFQYGESHTVTSFFNVTRHHNPGAAFSFLAWASGWQRWFFIGLGLAASGFILWMLRQHSQQKLFAFALACILSGALGNVIDRMVHGYVVDFLQFHFRFLEAVFVEGKFPTFNVADVAISVGAIGLILDEFLRVRKAR